MLHSPDPSVSHKLIREFMLDNDVPEVVYHWDEDYTNPPKVGPECLSNLCYDVMTTEEHNRPQNTYGFTITQTTLTWLV